jgi:hypothetical protein
MTGGRPINFSAVNAATLAASERIVRAFLPEGRREGAEWVARNPRRQDKKLGSFKVNLVTGRWADFATGDSGGDLVSLAAFIVGTDQRTAAIRLAESLGVDPFA